MGADKVEVESTSNQSADVTPILLRESNSTRLVFKPRFVVNPSHPEASINGDLCYQRKRRDDKWEDITPISLNSLKAGDGVRLNLHAAEVLTFYKELGGLYSARKQHGIPSGTSTFVRADPGGLIETVAALLDEGRISELLKAFVDWARTQTPDALSLALVDTETGVLVNFDAAIGASRLRRFVEEASDNLGNDSELWWQDYLQNNSWAISQIYAYPFVIVRGQTYVGGKTVANTEGSVADFLFKNRLSSSALLVEIKTPTSPLLRLKEKYRNQVYAPGLDLAGGVQQIAHARETFVRNYYTLLANDPSLGVSHITPRALLIIGMLPGPGAPEELRNFELFRSSLRDVEVVTFDELIAKAKALLQMLERS